MTYIVKEIFYTLQGEGVHSGRAAVFLRFAGCNLWSGRENDRSRGRGGCSAWCDTDFVGCTDSGGKFESPAELASRVASHWRASCRERLFVVCTGGEPLLQLDRPLVEALHAKGFEIAVETNGTQQCPDGIDWVCVSPKAGTDLVLRNGDELKLVYPQDTARPEMFADLPFANFFLQPMDGPESEVNSQRALEYCLENPQWRVSMQTHKYLGIR